MGRRLVMMDILVEDDDVRVDDEDYDLEDCAQGFVLWRPLGNG
jgi:hypothetical protein